MNKKGHFSNKKWLEGARFYANKDITPTTKTEIVILRNIITQGYFEYNEKDQAKKLVPVEHRQLLEQQQSCVCRWQENDVC